MVRAGFLVLLGVAGCISSVHPVPARDPGPLRFNFSVTGYLGTRAAHPVPPNAEAVASEGGRSVPLAPGRYRYTVEYRRVDAGAAATHPSTPIVTIEDVFELVDEFDITAQADAHEVRLTSASSSNCGY